MVFKGDIHVSAQSCTWKELTNYKKFERLYSLGKHVISTLLPWILPVLYTSASVSYAEWSGSDIMSKIYAFHHVATFPEVNNLQKNAFE